MTNETKALIAQLKTTRGEAYADLCQKVDAEIGETVRLQARAMKESEGKFTPTSIGYLCLEYGIAFKPMCEWILSPDVLPTGTYDLIVRDLKVEDILQGAREKYAITPAAALRTAAPAA